MKKKGSFFPLFSSSKKKNRTASQSYFDSATQAREKEKGKEKRRTRGRAKNRVGEHLKALSPPFSIPEAMIGATVRPAAHPLPALAPSAGGHALGQRRPSGNEKHHHHRRQVAGLQRQQQQRQRRGTDFSTAEARRDDQLVIASASNSGAAASSWPVGSSYEGRRRNNTTRASSTSPSSSTSASMPSTSRGRELLDAIADLPWQRVGVWAVVAWAAYQLKDFFGVRRGRVFFGGEMD